MCYQSFCWIKKHTVLIVLLVLWVGMLLVPPTVLTAVRVDFADSGYERAEQLKVLTSRSDTTHSLQWTAYHLREDGAEPDLLL